MKGGMEVEEQMSEGMGVEGSSGQYFAFCSRVTRKKNKSIRRMEAGLRGWGWTAAMETDIETEILRECSVLIRLAAHLVVSFQTMP